MNKRKRTGRLMLLCGVVFVLVTGCGSTSKSTNKLTTGNSIDNVLNQQVKEAETQVGEPTFDNEVTEETGTETEIADNNQSDVSDLQSIDIDLTQMSSDMVYATVYQMMVDPNSYIGQTVRMSGKYYATWYDSTNKFYHYCVISDATACCAQGMEFVWDDGIHIYPDEYPEENDIVEVTGVFQTYTEEGDANLYCRLKDADLKVVQSN